MKQKDYHKPGYWKDWYWNKGGREKVNLSKKVNQVLNRIEMASNKKSYDGAHDYKQELKSGYRHSERFETDTCHNYERKESFKNLFLQGV